MACAHHRRVDRRLLVLRDDKDSVHATGVRIVNLLDRAKRAVRIVRRKHAELWMRGYAAGRRDERKKLHAVLREAGLQHERYRKAEHEMNIVRLRTERNAVELRKQFERRIVEEQQFYKRRVAMLETRLPNGGFAPNG